jgi:O-antigen ligase
MSENIRALIVILVLSTVFFAVAHQSACTISGKENFTLRRNLWLILTLAAFLVLNFWIYAFFLMVMLLLMYANRHESNPPALFFFLLFVLPMGTTQIPGMGLINFLFDISSVRLLALIILLPAFLSLRKKNESPPFGRNGPDKMFAAYLLLTAVLYLRDSSFTDNLRQTFYLFIDVFLAYYVFSRSLVNMNVFRDAILSLVLAIMLLALIAIFESYKHWLLYSYLTDALKLDGITGYLGRDGIIRAIVTTGQAIALGYLMVVGIGMFLYVRQSIEQKYIRLSGMALLAGGLVVPLSRGPWIGAVVLIVVFIATGPKPFRNLASLAMVAILCLSIISVLPEGNRIINLLPFIGTTEKGSVDYREQLITNSMKVIKQNLWFGSVDYLKTPEMEEMRQGQGIIDIVNTYIQVALSTGLVGLGLFVSFFARILRGIYRAMYSISNKNSEEYLLGRALLSTLSAILLIIFSVSSISFIPIVYWSFAGLGVAYSQMVYKNANQGNQQLTL